MELKKDETQETKLPMAIDDRNRLHSTPFTMCEEEVKFKLSNNCKLNNDKGNVGEQAKLVRNVQQPSLKTRSSYDDQKIIKKFVQYLKHLFVQPQPNNSFNIQHFSFQHYWNQPDRMFKFTLIFFIVLIPLLFIVHQISAGM